MTASASKGEGGGEEGVEVSSLFEVSGKGNTSNAGFQTEVFINRGCRPEVAAQLRFPSLPFDSFPSGMKGFFK